MQCVRYIQLSKLDLLKLRPKTHSKRLHTRGVLGYPRRRPTHTQRVFDTLRKHLLGAGPRDQWRLRCDENKQRIPNKFTLEGQAADYLDARHLGHLPGTHQSAGHRLHLRAEHRLILYVVHTKGRTDPRIPLTSFPLRTRVHKSALPSATETCPRWAFRRRSTGIPGNTQCAPIQGRPTPAREHRDMMGCIENKCVIINQ